MKLKESYETEPSLFKYKSNDTSKRQKSNRWFTCKEGLQTIEVEGRTQVVPFMHNKRKIKKPVANQECQTEFQLEEYIENSKQLSKTVD